MNISTSKMLGERFDTVQKMCSPKTLDVDFMKPSTDCHERETVQYISL